MFDFTIPTSFTVEFVGESEKIDNRFSKSRVRIYYKFGNRNGTWITENFAKMLNESIVYVPIVATYDSDYQDFKDHEDGHLKKAYGFVPFDPNPTWEIGSDGKEYFTVDVILWTGYWPEAEKIIGKKHSMELDPSSISGEWKVVGGEYYFVYNTGSFLGLCALGDVFTPCFEESSFYTLGEKNYEFFSKFSTSTHTDKTGGEKMEDNIPEVNAPVIEQTITEPIVEQTIVEPVIEQTFTETEVEPVIEEPVVEPVVVEVNYQELYTSLAAEVEVLRDQITQITDEKNSLQTYKAIFLKNEKNEVLKKFSKKLSEDELEPFKTNIDNYTKEELEIKLSILFTERELEKDGPEITLAVNEYVALDLQSKGDSVAELIKSTQRK